jgi:hypothetical protein
MESIPNIGKLLHPPQKVQTDNHCINFHQKVLFPSPCPGRASNLNNLKGEPVTNNREIVIDPEELIPNVETAHCANTSQLRTESKCKLQDGCVVKYDAHKTEVSGNLRYR